MGGAHNYVKAVDASVNEIEEAKETAVALMRNEESSNVLDLFYSEKLDEVENGVRLLNEYSNKSWILSAMLVYTIIFNKDLYEQSGLGFNEYVSSSKKRLGLDPKDVSEQMSAARFFIKYHTKLIEKGYNGSGSVRKLSRAELALELSGNIDETVEHIVSDSFPKFKEWYSSFKEPKLLKDETKVTDIKIERGKYFVKNIEAVKISDELPKNYKDMINGYIKQIFESLAEGYEPAIIPVYDKKEARQIERLRDKNRISK